LLRAHHAFNLPEPADDIRERLEIDIRQDGLDVETKMLFLQLARLQQQLDAAQRFGGAIAVGPDDLMIFGSSDSREIPTLNKPAATNRLAISSVMM
jgi:hypothetical protein